MIKDKGIKRVYNNSTKQWDYELTDRKWKPSYKFYTKDDIKNQPSSSWFAGTTLLDHDKLMKELYYAQKKLDNKNNNKFQNMVYLKRYMYIYALVYIYNYLSILNPNKNIYFCKTNIDDIYKNKSALYRLKYRKPIQMPEKVDKVLKNDNIITYWVFNDSVIFKF